MFLGSMVAIVTPFKNGKVDEKAFGELIEFHITSGTKGIVPCGTTGESATLSNAEHHRVIEMAVEMANGYVTVLAGTGSNNTVEAIDFTRQAKSAGADGALLITPYYNKPTQEGLYQHFKAISEAVDIPIVLYNIPGRTGINMLPTTVARLLAFDNIVGMKEGSGSIQQIADLIHLCGKRLTVLSGDDAMTLPLMALGGKGVISVTANIAPLHMAKMVDAAARGDISSAQTWHNKLYPLHKILFVETNPIPVKAALSMMGKCSDEIRLPLFSLSKENRQILQKTLIDYGLIQTSSSS
ncbi:MAG: 4-hydroxy-tetrahydrodipicolinate synthase [Nitrospiria bacterium]